MSWGFFLLCVAAVALIALVTSAALGTAVTAGERWLRLLAPAAQARILLAAALAPAVATLAFLGGWVADIHVFGCHAHGCLEHRSAWPAAPAFVLGLAGLGRLVTATARMTADARRSNATCRALALASCNTTSGASVLPVDEPQAFVVGLLRPRLYVSRGLVGAAARDDLELVLAHERSHARRRDPLRSLIAKIGLAFHVPGIAGALERRLARAQEMAADADAASTVGDGSRVAEVLVRLARLRVARPALGTAWFGDDLDARVCALLSAPSHLDRPGGGVLVAAGVGTVVLALSVADPIHRGVEFLLRVLSA